MKTAKKIIMPNGEEIGIDGLYGKITNCLLEVPQRVKYTLDNGTLTIHAGTVCIVPYGTEDRTSEFPIGSTFLNDNFKVIDTQYIYPQIPSVYETESKFFVWAEVVSDISASISASATDYSVRTSCIEINTNTFTTLINTSSSNAKYDGTATNANHYRTDLNLIQNIDNGTVTGDVVSLPLLRVSADGSNIYGSINQVFNGLGYIGSTFWVDKGVKGLMPNDKNQDRTLKNIEYTTDTLNIATQFNNTTASHTLSFTLDHIGDNGVYYPIVWDSKYYAQDTQPASFGLWHDTYNNKMYASRSKIFEEKAFVLGEFTFINGKITSFTPKQPFRAVDWSDLNGNKPRIGQPQLSLDSVLPADCVWLEGATVSRTTYSKLFAIYGTTYGAGDGSTTFVLPNFLNRAIWGANGFGYISAGLPNITGTTVAFQCRDKNSDSGALWTTKNGTGAGTSGGGNSDRYISFNASRSNSIYGSSTTVQPPAIKVRVYARYQ